jgi:hypothetical protein
MNDIEKATNHRPTFKVAETPVFIPKQLGKQLFEACDELIETLSQPAIKELTQSALISGSEVPGETDHSTFLVIDFGICEDESGNIIPQLIEIQGFPSLYCYQDLCANLYRKHFDIPSNLVHLFNGLDSESYNEKLRKTIIADSKPENVILLEIEPHKQNTQVDFWATQRALGLKVACLTELKTEGRDVYYVNHDGKKIQVERIYNRIIFDDLEKRQDLKTEFDFRKEYDIHWVGHPNWFFRISKHTLPLFKSKYVPETFFLNKFPYDLNDLSSYVLKPLYSFSGQGVIINPARKDVEDIPEDQHPNFILQKKVHYLPVIETPDENAKTEIRMMLLWEDGAVKPEVITNLARLSKGEMVGVRYNKGKSWVGGTVGFFED